MEPHYNRLAGLSRERLAALSDGIFAVAMTLLVLDLVKPDGALVHSEAALASAVAALAPRLLAYLMSFVTLGIFWHGQQVQLEALGRCDRDLSWLNLAFLFAVSLVPFSTGLLASFMTFRLALLIYWANVLILGMTLYGCWSYAVRHGLPKESVTVATARAIRRRIVVAQTLYAIGAALCAIDPLWSVGFIVVVQLNYAIAPRIPGLSRL